MEQSIKNTCTQISANTLVYLDSKANNEITPSVIYSYPHKLLSCYEEFQFSLFSILAIHISEHSPSLISCSKNTLVLDVRELKYSLYFPCSGIQVSLPFPVLNKYLSIQVFIFFMRDSWQSIMDNTYPS